MSKATQFMPGQTYQTRSIGDRDCIITVTVSKRTAKTLTANIMGKDKTLFIGEREGIEYVKPWGSFSMAPTLTAAQVAA